MADPTGSGHWSGSLPVPLSTSSSPEDLALSDVPMDTTEPMLSQEELALFMKPLVVGIEAQFRLCPPVGPNARRSVENLCEPLAENLTKLNLEHKVGVDSVFKRELDEYCFRQWSLDEASEVQVPRDVYVLVLMSPAFVVGTHDRWHGMTEQIEHQWDHLKHATENLNLTDEECRIHMHFKHPKFTLPRLKGVSHAICQFEPAFHAMIPGSRLPTEYCQSHRTDNPNFRAQLQQECTTIIDQCEDAQQLARLMNLSSATCDLSKTFTWNFHNLLEPDLDYGVIEFRAAPFSLNAQQVLDWVELTRAFIFAGMLSASPRLENKRRDVGALLDFICDAEHTLPFDIGRVKKFLGTFEPQATKQPEDVPTLSPERLRIYKRKVRYDQERHVMSEKLSCDQFWRQPPRW